MEGYKMLQEKNNSIRQLHSSEAQFQGAADTRPFLSDQLLSATSDVGCLKCDMMSWKSEVHLNKYVSAWPSGLIMLVIICV